MIVAPAATATALDAAFDKYEGKETGESALLRKMPGSFDPGDIAVFDRYCCSYMMPALFGGRDVPVCTRIHAGRHVDFRKGKRLGEYDRLVTWTRPQRPTWMSVEQSATIKRRLYRYPLMKQPRHVLKEKQSKQFS